ncbi:hypothetical protein [Microvirga arabica]|uniref:hypothetical protein n=1 Tax=Microvirga arabica TaxID=1128671 RepID=UPI00193A6A8F|nr:hypothetical protein [Microvirga arabica]MBM1175458.1 hypothetical protein [Microvirga arabica]
MIPVPTGVRVWLATGHTDMRKGFGGLSQELHDRTEAQTSRGTIRTCGMEGTSMVAANGRLTLCR